MSWHCINFLTTFCQCHVHAGNDLFHNDPKFRGPDNRVHTRQGNVREI